MLRRVWGAGEGLPQKESTAWGVLPPGLCSAIPMQVGWELYGEDPQPCRMQMHAVSSSPPVGKAPPQAKGGCRHIQELLICIMYGSGPKIIPHYVFFFFFNSCDFCFFFVSPRTPFLVTLQERASQGLPAPHTAVGTEWGHSPGGSSALPCCPRSHLPACSCKCRVFTNAALQDPLNCVLVQKRL